MGASVDKGKGDYLDPGGAEDASRKPTAESAAASTCSILHGLGKLLPMTLLYAASLSIIGPYTTYNGLNFFAQPHTKLRHDDIHCELSPQEPYCQDAITDQLRVGEVMGFITPVTHVIIWPALGALSDAFGRRPIILCSLFLPFLAILACALFALYDVSLYLYYCFAPFADLPIGVLWFAYVIDTTEESNRAAAFGMLSGLVFVLGLVALTIGVMLTLNQAYAVATCLLILQIFSVWAFLPESLPPKKRQPLQGQGLRKLLPWNGMSILFRNSVLTRLSFVLICCGFIDGAFKAVGPSYMMKYMDWTATDVYLNGMISQMSGVIWLSFGLGKLSARFGEEGVLAYSIYFSFLYGPLYAFCSKPWHILLLNGIFAGPIAVTVPAIATLKSKLVEDNEQGIMQGAITTAQLIASSVGAPVFGGLFLLYNPSSEWTPLSGGVILLLAAVYIPVLFILPDLKIQLRVEIARRRDAASEPLVCPVTMTGRDGCD